jgi:hypothetical protein
MGWMGVPDFEPRVRLHVCLFSLIDPRFSFIRHRVIPSFTLPFTLSSLISLQLKYTLLIIIIISL